MQEDAWNGYQADPHVIGDVKKWLDKPGPANQKKALSIIAYLDKLSEEGCLPKLSALFADPKYKRIWRFCVRLWGNHRGEAGNRK